MDATMMLVQEEPRGPSQLIETPVTPGLSKVTLPVIQNLQNQTDVKVIIKALRLIPDTVLTNAPTIGGLNATLAELQKISLIIYSEEWEKGQLIPILTLCDTFTEASGTPYRNRTMRLDSWENVNWGKSQFIYSNGTLSVGNYTIILEAEYQKYDLNGKMIRGPR